MIKFALKKSHTENVLAGSETLATEICWQPASRLLMQFNKVIVAKLVTVGHMAHSRNLEG